MLARPTVDPVIHATTFKAANCNRPRSTTSRATALMDRWLAAEQQVRQTIQAERAFNAVPEHLF